MGGYLDIRMKVAIVSADGNWDEYVSKLPQDKQDIYFSREYCELNENDNSEINMFTYEDAKGNIGIYPFVKSLIKQEFSPDSYYDIETVYGYGGPNVSTLDNKFLVEFEDAFLNYCKNENIVAEFIRFHPLIRNENIFRRNIQVVHNRYTVWLDLTMSLDDIWKSQISTQNRNVIRKCEKNGLYVENSQDYDAFIEIYKQTMLKVEAEKFYFFDENYYQKLQNNEDIELLCVKKDEEIIAAAIFMYYGDYCHYHLAGSKQEYLKLSPNNILLWEAIKYAKMRGCKKFHLGGGLTDSLDDSLFRFKSRFSRSVADFYIGKRIHNNEIYNELINRWECSHNQKAVLLLQYKY